MDAYERIEDGQSLWDDSAFLRILLENTSEGLLTIDTESRIVFANPAIEDVLGYTPDELVGSSKMQIIPERLQPVHEASLGRYIETGEKNIDWDGVELPALHKDGHEIPVSVSLREHEYDGERLFTGIFTDISDRKQREEELRARNEELEEFAGVLSHDLRNPLNVARAFTEHAQDDYHGDELDRVLTALDRMDEIIDDMLARSRTTERGATGEETLPLHEVMGEAWDSVLAPYAKLELPEDTWQIDANRGRLKQLGENLFRNAVEHGGADVTVRVGILDGENGFYVEDDGTGLPNNLQDRTWLPEDTQFGQKRGYGLDIVEQIANQHGWELYLTESTSGGARFEFRDVDSLAR